MRRSPASTRKTVSSTEKPGTTAIAHDVAGRKPLSFYRCKGEVLIQIPTAIAEAEHERILEQIDDGRNAAIASGIRFGRKYYPVTASAFAQTRQRV